MIETLVGIEVVAYLAGVIAMAWTLESTSPPSKAPEVSNTAGHVILIILSLFWPVVCLGWLFRRLRG